MGISVIKYLIHYRIEQAKKLLVETDDLIYIISEEVGFHEFRLFPRLSRKSPAFPRRSTESRSGSFFTACWRVSCFIKKESHILSQLYFSRVNASHRQLYESS
jgi:AraC-like DNA-binding protein